MSVTITAGAVRNDRRQDALAKVRGTAEYAADTRRPNQLWAAFVTSPLPHARITHIDTDAARAMPGVRAVLTGADIGEYYLGRALQDWPVLARDRVLFVGQYVVAVAADTPEIAQSAADAVDVRYDELPAVFEPPGALAGDAPVLHPDPARYAFLPGHRTLPAHLNVQGVHAKSKGNAAAAFGACARVFEERFRVPRQHAGYIEPHACVVWLDGDLVHVVTTNKSPFQLQRQMAVSLRRDSATIVVEQRFIGGDFGGKGLSIDEFVCYFLAQATRRPIKAVRRHIADVQSTNTRHAAEIRLRTGVGAPGDIIAMEIDVVYNGGAFAAGKPLATLVPGHGIKVPYNIPNASVNYTTVYTNAVPTGHLRSPSEVQIAFAIESHLDTIAAALSIDPIDFRLRNVAIDGHTGIDGIPLRDPRGRDVLLALQRDVASRPLKDPANARGVALVARHIGVGTAHIKLRLHEDGRIEALTGVTDQGAGAPATIERIVASTLSVDPSRVEARRGNTAEALFDLGPGASRITHIVGMAAYKAALELRARLAAGAVAPLEVTGSYEATDHDGHPEWYNISGYAIEVNVDRETGQVTIADALFVAETGAIINPLAHQGQIDGGFVFGLGHALTEELESSTRVAS